MTTMVDVIASAQWWTVTCHCGKPGCWAGEPVYVTDEQRAQVLAAVGENEATWRMCATPEFDDANPGRVFMTDEQKERIIRASGAPVVEAAHRPSRAERRARRPRGARRRP